MRRSEVLVALGISLIAQLVIAFSVHSPSVFAPVVTRDLGVAPERVGLFVVIAYLVAMHSGAGCATLIQRYGPLRMLQVCIAAAGVGLLIGGAGLVLTLVAAALIVGFGQGLNGPSSAVLLAERSPRNMMALIFSVKQAGVPIGGALAGAIVPAAVLAIGWQASLATAGILFIAIALALQPLRAGFDIKRDRSAKLSLASAAAQMKSAVRLAWRDRRLRPLAIASLAYVGIQLVVMTYLVSYLHFELGYSLVSAGLVFAAAQGAGIAGRVLWGFIADRLRRGDRLLGVLGLSMAACAGAVALATSAWPIAAVYAVMLAFGITGVGWNGLFFAEIVRVSRPDELGSATGGAQWFSFAGGMLGPLIAGFLVSVVGYPMVFWMSAVLAAGAGINLLVQRPQSG